MSLFGNVSEKVEDTKFLQIGAPGEDLLEKARRVFQESFQGAATDTKTDDGKDNQYEFTQLFQYGPKEGPTMFLQECSRFLSEQYGDRVRKTCQNLQTVFTVVERVQFFSSKRKLSFKAHIY